MDHTCQVRSSRRDHTYFWNCTINEVSDPPWEVVMVELQTHPISILFKTQDGKMVRMGGVQIYIQNVISTNDWILEQNQYTATPVSEAYWVIFGLVSWAFLPRCPRAPLHFLILVPSPYHVT